MFARLRDRHVQDFGDARSLKFDLKRFTVVSSAVADFARDGYVREEKGLLPNLCKKVAR